MVYKYINSAIVVGDIFDQYNIKSEEFLQRTPNWILRALEDIQSYYCYVDKWLKFTINNNMYYLPEELKKVRNIWINGIEAQVYDGFNPKDKYDCDDRILMRFTDTSLNPANRENGLSSCGASPSCCVSDDSKHDEYIYNPYGGADLANWLNPMCNSPALIESDQKTSDRPKYRIENGWLKTSVNGNGVIKYAALPMEYDEANQLWFPLIPDNEDVRAAIGWYIMMRIIYRGYVHPVLSMDSNNPFTNPGIAYKMACKKARLSCASMNLPHRMNLTKEMTVKFGLHGHSERTKFR